MPAAQNVWNSDGAQISQSQLRALIVIVFDAVIHDGSDGLYTGAGLNGLACMVLHMDSEALHWSVIQEGGLA